MSDQPMSTPTPPLVARDPDEVLPPRRRRGLRPLTAVLAALVLVGAGFAGGIQAQKHYGGSSSSNSASSLRSAFASRFGAGRAGGAPGGAASFFGGGGAAGGATGGTQEVGQVSLIKGSTIYVADFLGNTLKIEIPATAKVSETSQLSVKGIHPGDTVTATVAKLPGGNYKATTVTVTPSTSSGT
jgi:hypothetical protein